MTRVLVVASSNQAFKFSKSEMAIGNAILAFEFRQNWLSDTPMFLHDWVHRGVNLSVVKVVVAFELRCSRK